MRVRPKVGDRIEFRNRGGVQVGVVVAVAVTGVHFRVEIPLVSGERGLWDFKCKWLRIALSAIIRVLPESD